MTGKGRPEYYGGGLATCDVITLYRAIGFNFSDLCARARHLTSQQTERVEKRIRAIEAENDYREIWSKLFTREGELKHFVTVPQMAVRACVSTSAVRRRIASGKLKAIKGFGGYYIDTRNPTRETKAA